MGRVCAPRTTLQTHHEVPNDDQIIPKSEKQRYTSRKGRLLLPPRSMKCRMRIMQHYGIAHHSYGKSMRATNYVANQPFYQTTTKKFQKTRQSRRKRAYWSLPGEAMTQYTSRTTTQCVGCSCRTSLHATHYVTNPLRGTK